MASVNWKKLHDAVEVKAQFRHSDRDMRKRDNHQNEHINKVLTDSNTALYESMSYNKTCQAYDERIADYDSKCTRKPRKDRVTCICLEVSAPEELSPDDSERWFHSLCTVIQERYGKEQVLQAYWHRDEVHEYMDSETGKKRLSREHAHIYVFPDVDGKLNARDFQKRSEMVDLNKAIETMTIQDFGIKFMTGKEQKCGRSVEKLKHDSEEKKLQALDEYLNSKQTILHEREKNVRIKEKVLADREKKVADQETQLKARRASVTRSEAHISTKLNEAEKILDNAKQVLKMADKAFEDMSSFSVSFRPDVQAWTESHYISTKSGNKSIHEYIIDGLKKDLREKAKPKTQNVRRGWTAADEVLRQYDEMMQNNKGRDDWQFGL